MNATAQRAGRRNGYGLASAADFPGQHRVGSMFLLRGIAIACFFSVLHPILSLFALLLLSVPVFLSRAFSPRARALLSLIRSGMIFLFAFWFCNLLFGHFWRNPLIIATGKPTSATVVSIAPTLSQHNDQVVMREELLIQPQDRTQKPVLSYFETDGFNISPAPVDGYTWPGIGQKFNVRYAPEYPAALVIISDDESEYSRGLRCGRRAEAISRLRRLIAADPGNAQYKAELARIGQDKACP
ncbi:hypothetical protein [Niveibacterium terrae]|uniref:hypothetical protein n=1 Tax=Niveibacterium terrae TaxID=3373598 RepID=UPI003A9104B0